MPQPPSLQATADPLIEAYRSAWERVLAEQERVTSDPRLWRQERRLREMSRSIGSVMDGLDSEMSDWVSQQFPKLYGAGLTDGAAAAGTSPAWSMIHQEAVEQLAYGVYNDLLSATTHVKDTTKDLIRILARQAGTTALIAGETAQGAGRKLAQELAKHSIAAIIYKDGSRHGLADYADMNLRTTTALGYNNGTLNAAPDVVFWECFDGPGCGWTFHEDTEQALGKIVTRDEALSWPISHPRCRRSFGPRPDMNKTASAKEKLGSVKPTQVEAQRVQDAQRLAQQKATSKRGPRTRRDAREPRKTQEAHLTEPGDFDPTDLVRQGLDSDSIARAAGIDMKSAEGLVLRARIRDAKAALKGAVPDVRSAVKPPVVRVAAQTKPALPKVKPPATSKSARAAVSGGPKTALPRTLRMDDHGGVSKIVKEAAEELNTRYPGAMKKLEGVLSRDKKGTWASYRASNRSIYITKHDEISWLAARRRMTSSGWVSPGTTGKETIYHEFGHHLDSLLGEADKKKLYQRVADHLEGGGPGSGKYVNDKEMIAKHYRREIGSSLSRYGATNRDELIAEAFSEYCAVPNPRPLAKLVGEYFDRIYAS